MPKINWKMVSDDQFVLIPEGDYNVKISSVEESKTQKGDEMWKLRLTINEGEYKGKTILTQLVFNDGGYGNIKKLYSAIFGTKLPNNCETTDILDEVVCATVVHSDYNGKTYANVAYAGYKSAAETEEDVFK